MPHDWKSDWKPERNDDWRSSRRRDDYADDEEEFCGNDDVSDCSHCGKSIYEQSEQCPHCGTYLDADDDVDESQPRRHSWLIIIGVLLFLAIFATWIFGRNWW